MHGGHSGSYIQSGSIGSGGLGTHSPGDVVVDFFVDSVVPVVPSDVVNGSSVVDDSVGPDDPVVVESGDVWVSVVADEPGVVSDVTGVSGVSSVDPSLMLLE
ncbi:hypothetical protein L3Y34_002756 [Caenorhabditis briggsae]|uniref:Uncharacterized protein n=1 Tax=Caenorhabditis briggsae TaxID=6238 RepID=A0AAE9DFM9_CAEBR|nr:hypothetical protein L3Y34_002756 [Caenorhabditis briggsae]